MLTAILPERHQTSAVATRWPLFDLPHSRPASPIWFGKANELATAATLMRWLYGVMI
jgi:hypothetical protein